MSLAAFLLLFLIFFPLMRGGNKKRSGGGCRQTRVKFIGPPPPTPQPSTHSLKVRSSKQSMTTDEVRDRNQLIEHSPVYDNEESWFKED